MDIKSLFTLVSLSLIGGVIMLNLGESNQTEASLSPLSSKYGAEVAAKVAAKDRKSLAKQRGSNIPQAPDGAGNYYGSKRLSKELTRIPSENYVDAIREKREFFSSNLHKANLKQQASPWQAEGPFQVGGRTRALEFHPLDSDIMFAGGVSGGIWKSIDAGQSWSVVADQLENNAVVSLAIDQLNPSIVFAGTGEGHYVGRPIVRSRGVEGNGVYVSHDEGVTWDDLPSTLNNNNFRFVNKLRSSVSGMLYAATATGIWGSSDKGISWTQLLDQTSTVGGCHEIEIQPDSVPELMLVSCGAFENSAVFKSTDAGSTWSTVLSDPFQGRTTLAFAPSNTNRVYALATQNQFGPYPHGVNGLYRSDDAGSTWLKVADTNSADLEARALVAAPSSVFDCFNTGTYKDGRLAGAGWYYNVLTVDPTNEDRVWAGGLDLFRSEDGGESFDLMSFWWASETINSYIHGDHHLVRYHPSYDGNSEKRVFFTSDGGIYQSTNTNALGATDNCAPETSEVAWEALNNNYAVTQFYHGSLSPDGRQIVAGSQDNGTQYRDASGNWARIFDGDGSYSAFDFKNPERVYVSSQYANLGRIDDISDPNSAVPAGNGIEEPGVFITPFRIDPNNSDRLFLAGLALYRSDNRGEQWQKISSDEYSMNYIDGLTALAIQPGNSNVVLAGGTDGFIYRHDSALSASRSFVMESIKLSDGYISSINFDANNPDKVVASVSTFGELHAYMSLDGGITWDAIDAAGSDGLPDLPVHDIEIAPHDTNTLYAGTDIGVYVSFDNGVTWQPLAEDLPNVPVEQIIYNRNNQVAKLFAFTYGRGVFTTMIDGVVNVEPVASQSSFDIELNTNEALEIDLADYVTDANQDYLTYSSSNLTTGFSLTEMGVLSGSTSNSGTSIINVDVSDGASSITLAINLIVSAPAAPPPPPPPSSSGGGSMGVLGILFVSYVIFRRRIKEFGMRSIF